MGLSQSCKGPLLNYRAVKAGAVKTCFWPWKVFHGRTASAEELFQVAGCPDGLSAQEICHWDEIPSPTYGFLCFLSMALCCSGTHARGPTSSYWVKQRQVMFCSWCCTNGREVVSTVWWSTLGNLAHVIFQGKYWSLSMFWIQPG